MGRRILSSSTKSNVVAAYKSGVPVAQIASDYGIGKSTVYLWAVNDNSPDRRNKSYNLDDVKTVLRQVRAGKDV
jgi:transposase-like protein